MFTPKYTNAFKKDFRRIVKRGYDIDKLNKVIGSLLKRASVSTKYKPHPLKGSYTGYMECHILPDWILIWKIDHTAKTVYFVRTGTHSDLF